MQSIDLNVEFFDPRLQTRDDKPWVILCDFDGTISLQDVTDSLLTRFGKSGHEDLEEAWLNGEIGSRECMAGQIALIDANKTEMDQALSAIKIDPAFKNFVKTATQQGIKVKILSDGLDYAIKHILKPYGLDHLPVYANRLLQVGERSWQLEFPHASSHCVKASGNCKCARAALYHDNNHQVLYVGDGSSDFCVSGKVDFVLAKDKLVTYCAQKNLAHLPISGFAEAMSFINENIFNPELAV